MSRELVERHFNKLSAESTCLDLLKAEIDQLKEEKAQLSLCPTHLERLRETSTCSICEWAEHVHSKALEELGEQHAESQRKIEALEAQVADLVRPIVEDAEMQHKARLLEKAIADAALLGVPVSRASISPVSKQILSQLVATEPDKSNA